MTKKEKSSVHIVEFPLIATPSDIKETEVRFSFLRQLYNAALGELFKRNEKLNNDTEFQGLLNQYRESKKVGNEKLSKSLSKQLAEKNKEYGLTEASIQSFTTANKNACCFADHLDAHSTQTIATRVFKAFSEWKYKGKGKPRFKSWKRAIHSAEGKAKSCLMIVLGDDKKPTRFKWKGLEIPVKLSKKDNQGYELAALELIGKGEWKYCRVLSRTVRGKTKLYLQILLSGECYQKQSHLERIKVNAGKRTGVDMAPSGFAAVSEAGAILSPLGAEISQVKQEISRLQRQNARRLRLANPDNYTSHTRRKGRKTVTVWKVKKGARNWIKTNAYLKTQAEITELHRQMSARRKQGHDKLANDIVALGNVIMAEKLSYKAWQRMFGSSVGANSPSQFMSTLRRKAENAGGRMIDINTWKAKLSQYDHVLDEYHKKNLSERIHYLGGELPVQRDLYSAFLAMCVCEKEHIVSLTTAHAAWSGVRHSLDAAVIRVNETASSRSLPTSFGLRELIPYLQSERLAVKATESLL
ncbi:hypothetical protein ACPFUC_001947 [Vibrio cholerae]|uniref:hypothetical protein n=1 Tax=Vibrio cholerae TaxID=666 RepID=UPI000E69DE72|nr:hypothetical protein [Vibrio cholerae]